MLLKNENAEEVTVFLKDITTSAGGERIARGKTCTERLFAGSGSVSRQEKSNSFLQRQVWEDMEILRLKAAKEEEIRKMKKKQLGRKWKISDFVDRQEEKLRIREDQVQKTREKREKEKESELTFTPDQKNKKQKLLELSHTAQERKRDSIARYVARHNMSTDSATGKSLLPFSAGQEQALAIERSARAQNMKDKNPNSFLSTQEREFLQCTFTPDRSLTRGYGNVLGRFRNGSGKATMGGLGNGREGGEMDADGNWIVTQSEKKPLARDDMEAVGVDAVRKRCQRLHTLAELKWETRRARRFQVECPFRPKVTGYNFKEKIHTQRNSVGVTDRLHYLDSVSKQLWRSATFSHARDQMGLSHGDTGIDHETGRVELGWEYMSSMANLDEKDLEEYMQQKEKINQEEYMKSILSRMEEKAEKFYNIGEEELGKRSLDSSENAREIKERLVKELLQKHKDLSKSEEFVKLPARDRAQKISQERENAYAEKEGLHAAAAAVEKELRVEPHERVEGAVEIDAGAEKEAGAEKVPFEPIRRTGSTELPPGFSKVESTSRPGEFSYTYTKTGMKYATLEQCWYIASKMESEATQNADLVEEKTPDNPTQIREAPAAFSQSPEKPHPHKMKAKPGAGVTQPNPLMYYGEKESVISAEKSEDDMMDLIRSSSDEE